MRAIEKSFYDTLKAEYESQVDPQLKMFNLERAEIERQNKKRLEDHDKKVRNFITFSKKKVLASIDKWEAKNTENSEYSDEISECADVLRRAVYGAPFGNYIVFVSSALRKRDGDFIKAEVARLHQKFYDDNGGAGPFDDGKVIASCQEKAEQHLNEMRQSRQWFDVID